MNMPLTSSSARFVGRYKNLDALVGAVLAGSGQKPEESETLPPEAYTSQEFFDLECEAVFRKDWICVGHVAQLPKVGDYFSVDLLNERLMVVRGEDRIRVLSRVCLHRWAPIVEGAGSAIAKRLACPFHKWTYDLTGQLVGAPLMSEAKNFNRKDCKLPEVRSEVFHGLIFITLADEPLEPISERLADLVPRLANYDLANARIAYTQQFEVNFNWKIAAETFMECYHHIGAHLNTLEKDFPAHLSWVEEAHAGWAFCHNPRNPEAEPVTNGLPAFPELRSDEGHGINLYLLYPSSLMALGRDRASWIGLMPIGPDKALWTRIAFCHENAFDDPEFESKIERSKARGNKINQEDVEVNELQQRGASSTMAPIGRLSHLELVVHQLADYVRRKVAAHGAGA